jgi:hypothetical protein
MHLTKNMQLLLVQIHLNKGHITACEQSVYTKRNNFYEEINKLSKFTPWISKRFVQPEGFLEYSLTAEGELVAFSLAHVFDERLFDRSLLAGLKYWLGGSYYGKGLDVPGDK